MLDSSRREVLVSAVVNTLPDVATGTAVAIVARLTGIEALEADDEDDDETTGDEDDDETTGDESSDDETGGDGESNSDPSGDADDGQVSDDE